ncbi:ATP-binding protein [Melioribacter sp. OK-6-Me]|uniref:ATP-binding protein n=1 Tax=unclassified Melioribacter TaxID=2627329 RepID=UPI003ED8EF50
MLVRSLGNLLKNTLEASKTGDTVTVKTVIGDDQIIFSVHNPAFMPQDVQMQIFNRSFSTKEGTGRGLGTYSTRLFIEKYLNGEVYFHSNEEEGTVFNIKLKRNK